MKIYIIREETANLTGHRPKSLPWGYDESKQSCINFKTDTKKVFEGAIKFGLKTYLTGMAEGFDMIGAEILIELRKTHDIKIVAVVPCLGQELKWKPSQQARYKKILSQCDDIVILSDHYYKDCMNDRNKFMVDHSSVCIACWNGKPSGTGNTVRFAKQNGNKVRVINPNDYT